MAKLTKRHTKAKSPDVLAKSTGHWVNCKVCQVEGEWTNIDIKSITCSRCFMNQTEPPKQKPTSTSSEKRPRGWHLKKEFVTSTGEVYCKGMLIHKP